MTDPYSMSIRIRAMLRWLTDEGHVTPIGVRQITRICEEAEDATTRRILNAASARLERPVPVSVDPDTGAVYVLLAEGAAVATTKIVEFEDGTVNVDVDEDGRIVGIEVIR